MMIKESITRLTIELHLDHSSLVLLCDPDCCGVLLPQLSHCLGWDHVASVRGDETQHLEQNFVGAHQISPP